VEEREQYISLHLFTKMNKEQYRILKAILFTFFIGFTMLSLMIESLFFYSMVLYLSLASLFLINRLIFVGVAMILPKKYKRLNNPYTVILPTKNEDKKILNRCIGMLVRQKGTKQILIGDDGSTIPIKEVIKQKYLKDITIIRSEGIGKKEMQITLLKYAKHLYIVQMDSDVILSKNTCLKKLVSYFDKDNKIGLINGKIRLITDDRIVEKIQEVQYLCANEIGRSGMGRFGINPCATGELLAFRWEVFTKYIEEYRTRTHLGQLMKFGEDRLMTNIFLREGYKSIVAEDVVCYTYPKKNLKSLLKQQKRWKLSGVRESIRCAREVKNPYLKVWSILNFALPVLFYLLFINLMIYYLTRVNISGILLLFSSLIVISFISEIPIIFKHPSTIFWVVPFVFYNLILITPLWFVSIFNQTETRWGTR